MILSINTLSDINSLMLQRGAPIINDDIGYNKPDYAICRSIFFGMSYTQSADICNRLQKYIVTQLPDINKLDLSESQDYYQKLAGQKPGITLQYGSTHTAFYFAYDMDIISIVKSANIRKWDNDSKCWYVSNSEVVKILDKLSSIADTDNAKQYFLSQCTPIVNPQNPVIVIADAKIILTISDIGKYINVRISKYHAGYVNTIKICNDRKYHADNYSWDIAKTEISALIQRLQPFICEIDIANLHQYVIINTKPKITLKPLINAIRQPFDHQLVAVKFLLEHKKAILADEMGAGKTTSAIIASYNIPGKKLIVCPASLKLNWQKEIKLVDTTANIGIINGKSITDLSGNDWYIINYDILSKNLESILATDFTSVIFDECHYIKSINNSGKPTADRGKAALQIAEKISNVYMLTGTPITNKTKDIFNTLKAISHPMSVKWMTFAMRYCAAYQERYGWNMDGSSNMSELHEKLKSCMMRRLKSELLDLPEKIRSFIPIEINVKEYERLFYDYMSERKNIDKGLQLVKLNALRHLLAIQKIPATIEQIENITDQEKPIVIFTCYQEVVNQILAKFPEAGKITGECSSIQRQKTVDDFQAGNIKILVCNIVAAGVGLTLTASDTVIFNDFDWTPANHVQAEDRVHRIGQNNKCNIIYMYADNAAMDSKLSKILEQKLQNINKIIDNKDDNMFNTLIANL